MRWPGKDLQHEVKEINEKSEDIFKAEREAQMKGRSRNEHISLRMRKA